MDKNTSEHPDKKAPRKRKYPQKIVAVKEFNAGSEEEDGAELEEQLEVVPRRLRMLIEPEEDYPQDPINSSECDFQKIENVIIEIINANAIDTGDVPKEPKDLFKFEWTPFPDPQINPLLRREVFIEQCGAKCGPIKSPYDAFVKIWDRPIMEHIVAETNRYAQEYAANSFLRGNIGPSSRITNWKDTTVDELYIFFAITMAISIVVKSNLSDYWNRKADIFATPGFAVHMTLKRFQILSRCLHFRNNADYSGLTPAEAKIFKLQPIVDHLNNKFPELYSLSQDISLDESLTLWKGPSNIKQFIPNKAASEGIKTYEVCDSRSGYLWRFKIHSGPAADNVDSSEPTHYGYISRLVLSLLSGLEHRGHTVWMNNYYNSPILARILKTRGFDCVGTLRTNRQHVPDHLKYFQNTDMMVGELRGATSGDVDVIVWQDRNRVPMISTYHGMVMAENNKPTVVNDYNISMGGVDRKDQMLSSFPLERKRNSIWYKKIFRRFLNASILNAYIIYKCQHSIEHRDFRKELVTSILEYHGKKHDLQPLKHCPVTGVPKFTKEMREHFPSMLLRKDETKQANRRKCVYCKVRRTQYQCKPCKVSLCFSFDGSSCFLDYHS